MIFNVSGGGGAALNFKVLAYPTEQELLASAPAENTIGIVTTAPITSWVFSKEEPSPLIPGMVWINTSTDSTVAFNALKKNSVMVYPVNAKQVISGVLVDVTAKIYQGGAWVDWAFYLYSNGNEFTSLTGGWTSAGKGWDSSQYSNAAGTPSLAKNNDRMILSMSSDGGAVFYTSKKIDLTGREKIILDANVVVTGANSDSTARLTVWSALGTYTVNNVVAALPIGRVIKDGLFELPIPGVDGEHYVGISLWKTAGIYATVEMRSLEIK